MNVTATVSEAKAGVRFYYIAATDGDTRVFPDFVGDPDNPTFSVVYEASQTSTFAIGIQEDGVLRPGSQVSFTLTVIGMFIVLMYVVSIRAL